MSLNKLELGKNVVGGYIPRRVAIENGFVDSSSLLTWFSNDPKNNYLELTRITDEVERRKNRYNFMVLKDLLRTDNHLKVNGVNDKIYYGYNIVNSEEAMVSEDTSMQSGEIGKGISLFTLKLNKPFQQGDRLSCGGGAVGIEVIVSEEFPVIQEGDSWVHQVRMVTNDEYMVFPSHLLKVGVEWNKVSHSLGEFSTQFSTIQSNIRVGRVENEFVLGNHLGVEVSSTYHANTYRYGGGSAQSKVIWDIIQEECSYIGKDNDIFYFGEGQVVGEGSERRHRMNRKNMIIADTLQHLAFKEFMRMQNVQCAYGKGAIIKDGNGHKIMNEGIYHQRRRGYRITLDRPDILSINDFKTLSSIISSKFRLNPSYRTRATLKCGTRFYHNAKKLFNVINLGTAQNYTFLAGSEGMLPKPLITGLNNQNLNPIEPIGFNGFILEMFNMEFKVEIDPSLDYFPSTNTSGIGFVDGYPITSFSAYLDMNEFIQENYEELMKGAKPMPDAKGNGKINFKSSVYKVTQEAGGMYYGYENGRYSSQKTSDIVSSNPQMMESFWVHGHVALFLADLEKSIIMELNPKFSGL